MSGAKKSAAGRKSTFVQSVADDVLALVTSGKTLTAACKAVPGAPTPGAFRNWCSERPELEAAYVRAREVGADRIADEALAIIDEPPPQSIDRAGREYTDSGHVQWQRNRFEARMKLLAVWDPKRYGNRVGIDGQVSHTHAFPSTFAQLMAQETGASVGTPETQTH